MKLEIELIPKSCSFSNVRSLLPKKYWDLLRKKSYLNAGDLCEVCKDHGQNQGYRHKLECHEIWEYNNSNNTQKLLGLISLCPKCHQVKHFGRSSAIGKQAEVFKHMEIVNSWTHKQCVTHVVEAMNVYKARSKKKWKIDLSILHENYEVPKELIVEAEKKKRVIKRKFKRKKK
jgi:hypothetical protein